MLFTFLQIVLTPFIILLLLLGIVDLLSAVIGTKGRKNERFRVDE